MAEQEEQIAGIPTEEALGFDVEMGGADATEGGGLEGNGAEEDGENGAVIRKAEEAESSRMTFIDYLKSPIVELVVGTGTESTHLTAHQALLIQSPYFKTECEKFSATTKKRHISLQDDDLSAVGCFLQYLYTSEYFPRVLSGTRTLEALSPAGSEATEDTGGEQLLYHARIYTLAQKLSMPGLASLARSKIHLINSTARGEIAYARYVYQNTSPDDDEIRRPVAAFWAHRSHVLRHEAEEEFRRMCLEFPQFGFDVLTLLLDGKEKGKGEKEKDKDKDGHTSTPGTSRKRLRASQI